MERTPKNRSRRLEVENYKLSLAEQSILPEDAVEVGLDIVSCICGQAYFQNQDLRCGGGSRKGFVDRMEHRSNAFCLPEAGVKKKMLGRTKEGSA